MVASNDLRAGETCFARDSRLAGSPSGTFIDDLNKLQEVVTIDTRMWGFQVCSDRGSITGFRILIANNYGIDDHVDLNPFGPGTTNCARYKLGDPIKQPIESISIFTD